MLNAAIRFSACSTSLKPEESSPEKIPRPCPIITGRLTNLSYAKHQLGVIYTNYHCVLTCLQDFAVHGIGLFALAGGVLIPGGLRQRLQDEPWRRAVVPVVYLVGWYLPVASGDTAVRLG